jgi:hypothetical protein
LKAAAQAPPREAGIDLADWNRRVVQEFVRRRFGRELAHSSYHHSLHRLGFVLKRPRKRLLKHPEGTRAAKCDAFVRAYAALREEATERGATIFFADEAHFYADVHPRCKNGTAQDRSPVSGPETAVPAPTPFPQFVALVSANNPGQANTMIRCSSRSRTIVA